MSNFYEAYRITMSHEGGYANDPDDSGGETYCGIARKYHSGWSGWIIIDKIKETRSIKVNEIISDTILKDQVLEFYKIKFWNVNSLDRIHSQKISNELFDTGVNMGTGTAAKFLQEAANLLNKNGRRHSDLVVDGKIGSKTISTINGVYCASKRLELALLKTLNGLQFMKYVNICRRKPSQKKFFYGWLNRV